MRWLLIGFLVSAVSLVLASAGIAYHVWRQRERLRRTARILTGRATTRSEEIDVETEESAMNLESSTQSAPASLAAAPAGVLLRSMGIVLVGSAFIAACAQASLPLYFTPVPLTIQPFAVLLVGLLLSPRLAVATVAAYLAEGAMGLPVFSPSPVNISGLAHLFGPTGGYLLSYPVAALLVSFLSRRGNRGFYPALAGAVIGNLTILAGGALWLAIVTRASGQTVLTQAILPFLPGDAIKVTSAAAIAATWQRARRRRSSIHPTN
jgi:biotin transport system substrate-specific component